MEGSKLVEAAASAAAGQQYPAPALYVVATPIGNLADITLRALHVLASVDAIACEDTRHSAALLRHFAISKPLLAVHEHNEREAAGAVLARLARGERVAYVSDAGTPAVSDPGAALVAAVRAAGHRIVPVPGASSALAALSAAGDVAATSFSFVGFLDARGNDRARAIAAIARAPAAQIVFEAPHRIEALAGAFARRCPARTTTVCRELTKQFETIATMAAGALPAWLAADANRQRGEFVIVLHAIATSESARFAGAGDGVLRAAAGGAAVEAGGVARRRDQRPAAQHALRARARAQGARPVGRRAALASPLLTAWARPGRRAFARGCSCWRGSACDAAGAAPWR